MNKHALTILVISAFIFSLSGCNSFFGNRNDQGAENLPRAEREFRAVWVATVANIDWPSKPGLSTERQQKEALAILDTAATLNMNAIILQVRPHCDALYDSALEPWSGYLSGTQGKRPDPYYDPLTFWIDEAHKRGMELHAWFNPYRALLTGGNPVPESSIVLRRPDLAKKINENMYWLDPSMKETQDISYNVVMYVVKRYDVDGIHFDDYFYPYNDGKFPDDEQWEIAKAKDPTVSREEWRRSHVNGFIERVYRGIKAEKRNVKFGLSPFGIWRPKNPPSIQGYDQYNMLYADAKLWLNEGWIDYWTPQLYWPVNQIPQSFPVLLGWWAKENTQGRNLWPGMIISRPKEERTADEIFNQIMITRGIIPDAPGQVHFSMKSFMRDSSLLNNVLRNGPYKRQALVPTSPWLDDRSPAVPTVMTTVENDSLFVTWKNGGINDAFRIVLYFQYNSTKEYRIITAAELKTGLPLRRAVSKETRTSGGERTNTEVTEVLNSVTITAVDRMGNESRGVDVKIPVSPDKGN
jgi:uncharacterized lipoprotein YddW (UPF0748 family)